MINFIFLRQKVSSSLPKTSYFKMVDIWLLFCIVMNFIIILVHAVVDYVYHTERSIGINSYPSPVKKVAPMPARPESQQQLHWADERPKVPFNIKLKSLIFASKVLVLSVFLVFSVCYWGYILF